jgi:hypothetical protein
MNTRPPKPFRAAYELTSDGDYQFLMAWHVETIGAFFESLDDWESQFKGVTKEDFIFLDADQLGDYPDLYTGGVEGVEQFNNSIK